MLLADLIKYAKAKGLRYEINYPCSRNEKYNPCTDESLHFGMEFKPHVWYWWHNWDYFKLVDIKTFKYELDTVNYMYFRQRYNQNNGAIIKAYRTGSKAEYQIKEFLESKK